MTGPNGETGPRGAKARPRFRTLSEELAELERTDPAVREAAENYDRTVRRILRRPPEGERA